MSPFKGRPEAVTSPADMSTAPVSITIELAAERDVPLVLSFIKQLGEYERLGHEVVASEADLRTNLFGPERVAYALIAYADGEPAGFALYFFNFSTFLAKPGLYLEDLFVSEAWRRHGVGRALLARLAQIAIDRGCGRMEWSVLEWNELALGFYRGLGARTLDEWRICRLTGAAIEALAAH
jgi:GNAT superfamily N-acetyltransferase